MRAGLRERYSVVMTTFAVDMAVAQFFQAGVTHIGDFNGEMQRLPREWMIAIDGDFIAIGGITPKQKLALAT